MVGTITIRLRDGRAVWDSAAEGEHTHQCAEEKRYPGAACGGEAQARSADVVRDQRPHRDSAEEERTTDQAAPQRSTPGQGVAAQASPQSAPSSTNGTACGPGRAACRIGMAQASDRSTKSVAKSVATQAPYGVAGSSSGRMGGPR